MGGIEIDSHDSAQGHQTNDVGNLQQTTRVEVAHRTNGDASKHIETVVPIPQPKVGSTQK
jgi:hypothetical protein